MKARLVLLGVTFALFTGCLRDPPASPHSPSPPAASAPPAEAPQHSPSPPHASAPPAGVVEERAVSVRENPAGETPARATELRLALENESSTFGAPLRFVLTLHNVSADPITVDGLLPPRASANPPMLEVTAADGRYLRTRCGTRPGLQTDAPMHLPPGASIVLMTGDLTACSGEARDPGDQELRAFPASETFFAPGAYEVRATFQPTSPDPGRFQGYGCASEVSALRVRGD